MPAKRIAKAKKILLISTGNEYDVVMFAGIYERLAAESAASITLLVKNTARPIVPFIKNVDRVLFFDENKLKNRINDPSFSLIEKFNYVKDYLYELATGDYDHAINLSSCTIGATIINIIKPRRATGFYINEYNRRRINGDWMQVFFASVNAEKYNSYSYYDLLTAGFASGKMRCLPSLGTDRSLEPLYEKIRTRFRVNSNELILISCASRLDEKGRWDLQSIVRLANLLEKKNEKVVLFSGPEGRTALKNVESYVNRGVTCEVMSGLDLILFMKYCRVFISQSMPALAVPAAFKVPVISISINENNFRENFPLMEGGYIISSNNKEVSSDLIYALIETINSNFNKKVIESREEVQDIPVDIPKGVACYFTKFDKDGFLRYDSLEPQPVNKDELYMQMYREMWKVILNDKLPRDALNDYIEFIKYNYRRNDILAAISLARYDTGTVELFQERNKDNLQILGSIINNRGEKKQFKDVDKTNREILMLFNRNPFLLPIKFYFLILYENIKINGAPHPDVKEMFEFSRKLERVFNFIAYCLKNCSESIFEDFNMLDEVVGSDESMIYH